MPVQGLVRLRKHQFGRQAAMGTKVTASRAYPFSGTPSVDLTWTDPDIDAGSIDPTAPPYRGAGEFTASLDDPSLKYNNLPLHISAALGENEVPTTGGGGQETWTHKPPSTTAADPDLFTYEFGDDVLTDWFQLGDGLIETIEFTGSREADTPLTVSTTWRFGSAASTGSTDSPVDGTVPTPGLSVSTTDKMVYLKDCAIYIASTIGAIAAGQITDALHSFSLRITNTWDLKRYANGDQLFDIDAYGLSERLIELECTWAKTSDIVGTGSEADAWFSNDSVNRYVRLKFTSVDEAATGVPYSWQVTMPLRYYTRAEGEVGGNTVVVLTGHAFYDPGDFAGVIESIVVNTVDEDDLDGDAVAS
jgi:hypothetical protein